MGNVQFYAKPVQGWLYFDSVSVHEGVSFYAQRSTRETPGRVWDRPELVGLTVAELQARGFLPVPAHVSFASHVDGSICQPAIGWVYDDGHCRLVEDIWTGADVEMSGVNSNGGHGD